MDNLQGGDALFLSKHTIVCNYPQECCCVNFVTQYTTTLTVVLHKSYQQALFRYSISWHAAPEWRLLYSFKAHAPRWRVLHVESLLYTCVTFL